MDGNADAVLRQPTTVILSDAGSSHFVRRNHRLNRFRLLNGREEHGLMLRDYDPDVLAKLLSRGLVRRVQYRIGDIVSERKAFSRYMSAVATGFLAMFMDHALRELLEQSDLTRHWNRARPQTPIGSPEAAAAIRRMLDARQLDVARARTLVRTQTLAQIRETADGHLDRESVEPRLGYSLSRVPEEVWFFLVTAMSEPAGRMLFVDVTKTVATTVSQGELTDYLALVWTELLTHLQHGQESIEPTEVGLLVQISGPGIEDAGSRREDHRMHMIAASGEQQMRLLKTDLDKLGDPSNGQSMTVEQFYQAAGQSQTNLGVYYLSFLEDACRRLQVGFRSFSHGGTKDGTLNLILSL